MADSLEAIINHLRPLGIPAGDILPKDVTTRGLPRIHVQLLTPGARYAAFNHLGMDTVTYDIDVYFTPDMYNSGEAVKTATKIRWHLYRLRDPNGVRCLDVGTPHPRPSLNENMYRLGFELSIGVPA